MGCQTHLQIPHKCDWQLRSDFPFVGETPCNAQPLPTAKLWRAALILTFTEHVKTFIAFQDKVNHKDPCSKCLYIAVEGIGKSWQVLLCQCVFFCHHLLLGLPSCEPPLPLSFVFPLSFQLASFVSRWLSCATQARLSAPQTHFMHFSPCLCHNGVFGCWFTWVLKCAHNHRNTSPLLSVGDGYLGQTLLSVSGRWPVGAFPWWPACNLIYRRARALWEFD